MKVFITGGTTGIGWSLAEEYLKAGHEVGVCGRDLAKLPAEYKDKYPKLKRYQVNVLDKDELRKAVHDFAAGKLDLMIANAGRAMDVKSRTPNFDVARNVIEVNVIGVLNSFEPAIHIMQQQGHGHIAAVASVAGFVGLPGAGPYSASKAAVLKLCESFSLDLRGANINVTAIAPGFIDTPLTRVNTHPMPFLMSSEEAAKRIVKALDKKVVLYAFPKRMKILITLLDKMPRFLYRMIMKVPVANYSKE